MKTNILNEISTTSRSLWDRIEQETYFQSMRPKHPPNIRHALAVQSTHIHRLRIHSRPGLDSIQVNSHPSTSKIRLRRTESANSQTTFNPSFSSVNFTILAVPSPAFKATKYPCSANPTSSTCSYDAALMAVGFESSFSVSATDLMVPDSSQTI